MVWSIEDPRSVIRVDTLISSNLEEDYCMVWSMEGPRSVIRYFHTKQPRGGLLHGLMSWNTGRNWYRTLHAIFYSPSISSILILEYYLERDKEVTNPNFILLSDFYIPLTFNNPVRACFFSNYKYTVLIQEHTTQFENSTFLIQNRVLLDF